MTTENNKNPSAEAHPNPTGIEESIERVRFDLEAQLPWIEKAFGRAKEFTLKGTDKDETVPMCYQNGGEYYNVLPNDALQAYSFFRVIGSREPFEPWDANQAIYYLQAPVDLIVWCNLKKIDPSKDYIFTEELINAVQRVLAPTQDVQIIRVWDDAVEDVFKGYTLNPQQRDLLMYPFQAFRIEMMLGYRMLCQDFGKN